MAKEKKEKSSNYFGKKQWLKIHFDKYWKDLKNDEQLQQGYKLFLDIIIDLEFSELTGFAFIDLQLKNCVDKNWAIESEILPQWLEGWCAIDQEKSPGPHAAQACDRRAS